MRCPQLNDLPVPPVNKTGWPWTEQNATLPVKQTSGAPWPKISIVTPSFNQGDYLEETIRSVLLQGYPNLEYIIIDGGSTDNSVETIKKYEPWLAYWISEPDRGQAHAINKGLQIATGEIFQFINSDDYLAASALSIVACAFNHADVVAGACRNFQDGANQDVILQNAELNACSMITHDQGLYHQPGVWLRTSLVRACGGFDEQYHYLFDRDLMIRYLAHYAKVNYTTAVLVNFRIHSLSKSGSRLVERYYLSESVRIFENLLSTQEFSGLHTSCSHYLRRFKWIDTMSRIAGDPSLSRRQRQLKIALLVCQDPSIRAGRLSLGLMRRC